MTSTIVVILFVIICVAVVLTESSGNIIRIPVEVHAINGRVSIEFFEFPVNEGRVEFAVANFCENFQVKKSFCVLLYKMAKTKQRDRLHEVNGDNSVNKMLVDHVEFNFTEKLLKHPSIINAELSMYSTMISDEPLVTDDSTVESDTLGWLKSSLNIPVMSQSRIARIVVIHSLNLVPFFDDSVESCCAILSSILSRVVASGLLDSVHRVYVLNYGHPVPRHLHQVYSSVEFIQVSDDVSQLEIPTLRIVQLVSKTLVENSLERTQLLFLSTLGSDYLKDYQAIDDWRNLLLHFMVDEHQSAYHLLASGEFDAVIVNHHANQYFYWSTAKYLSRLPVLSPNGGSIVMARKWLLSASTSRFFIAHSSTVDHLHQVYPEYCYRADLLKSRSQDKASQEEFRKVCLAEPPAQRQSPCSNSSENSDDDVKGCYYNSVGMADKKSYARCMGLETGCA